MAELANVQQGHNGVSIAAEFDSVNGDVSESLLCAKLKT